MSQAESNGWSIVPVSSVVIKPLSGEWGQEDTAGTGVKVLRTTNFTDSGFIDYTEVVRRSIELKKVEAKALRDGDILIEKSGGSDTKPVGRVVFYQETSENFLFNNFTALLRPNTPKLNSRFLFTFLFVTYWNGGTKLYENKTTGIHNLKLADYLDNTMIPIPPIEDQEVFAAYVEQSDKSKFTGFKSQFIEMFGDTHMRSDHSRQWKEVVEIINGKDYKSIQVEDGGYPVYGTGGEMARASDYLSPANSILLGRKGTIDKPLLIREKYWNVDTAFGAVPDEKVLHYVYFYWHCKTIDFNVLNKGTTLPSTTKVDLLNLWIKIPSMEEQTRFGSIVEQADKSEFELRKSIEAIDQVIKSLINN